MKNKNPNQLFDLYIRISYIESAVDCSLLKLRAALVQDKKKFPFYALY